MLRIKLCS